ncbi:MAG: hypothetical protein E3J25_11970 [Anaerolineales bacterium]|nr:MAG: hypothetical protein E3J25_11970 [Anaerolineales bacterium]
MIWWILTYLDNWRPPHKLGVLAETNLGAHLFMKWSKHKPARRPVYKRVRAVNVWCGYEYIWDTPNLVEQSQPGITFEHLFGPISLAATDHVWYYLFSIGERPFKECQGPLIHVPPPELPMPSARIYHSVPQTIPWVTSTVLQFDSVLYDDYGLYDPAQPDRFTISAGALYAFGCSFRFATTLPMGARCWIHLAGGPQLAEHSHFVNGNNWPGCSFSFGTQYPLRPGDAIQVSVYHTSGAGRDIAVDPLSSPHFWIAQIGAYPISPP